MANETRRIRWGVLGCARIARILFNAAAQESRTGTLQAIASRDRAQADSWVEEYGYRTAYGSYGALLEDGDVDAVYIPLPNHMHAEWAIACAEAGKHVFCEKPVAMNAAEAERMMRAAEQAGVVFVENFSFRFHPRTARVREIIDSGSLGEVRSLVVSFHNKMRRGDNIRYLPEMGGGVAMDLGAYAIAYSRFVYGCEPVSVIASAAMDPVYGVDMSFNGVLDFGGGRMATFATSFETRGWQHARILGSEAELTLRTPMHPRTDLDTTIIKHEKVAASGATRIDEEEMIETPIVEPFTAVVDNIGDHLIAGVPLMLSPADAIANMRAIDACRQSAREGRAINLD